MRLLHMTALTSLPCSGRSPNQDLSPSTFCPSNSERSCNTLLELALGSTRGVCQHISHQNYQHRVKIDQAPFVFPKSRNNLTLVIAFLA